MAARAGPGPGSRPGAEIFYVERDDAVELGRVLHLRRDLPARLGDPDSR